jgi:AcrR family transcriptional regulator
VRETDIRREEQMARTNEKDKKTLEIILITRKLIEEKGYDDLEMSDIARAVGIKKSTLYYYFKNKKDLFLKTIEYDFLELKSLIQDRLKNKKTPSERLKTMITVFVEYFYSNKNSILIFMRNQFSYIKVDDVIDYWDTEISKTYNEFIDFMEENVKAAQKMNFLNSKVNSRVLTYSLLGLLTSVVIYRLYSKREPKGRRETINEVLNIITKGYIKKEV